MVSFASQLTDHPGERGERRRLAVSVMQAALEAVDPGKAVRRFVQRVGNQLHVDGRAYDLDAYERV